MHTLKLVTLLVFSVLLLAEGVEHHFKCATESGCNFTQACDPTGIFSEIPAFDPELHASKSDYHLICKSSITDEVAPMSEIVENLGTEEEFRCKPKLNCNFSKCGPIPQMFLQIQSFDLELYKKNSDFPILCTTKPIVYHFSRGVEETRDARLENPPHKEYHCKAVPWCDFSTCDPIPRRLSRLAATAYRRTKEYHLSCKPKVYDQEEREPKNELPGDKDKLSRIDIKSLLEKNNAKLMKQMNARFELIEELIEKKILAIVEEKFAAMKSELQDLSDKVDENSKGVKKTLDKYKKMKDLTSGVANQLRGMTTKMEDFDERCTCQNWNGVTEKSPLPEFCEVKDGDGCFWAVLGDRMTYIQAMEVCRQSKSKVAMIESQTQYTGIQKYIQSEMDSPNGILHLWIGMIPGTKGSKESLIDHPGSYFKWYPGAPYFSPKYTHTALKVKRDNSYFQGMYNADPKRNMDGVVCQYERGS